jgi:prephenate dehydrogenase
MHTIGIIGNGAFGSLMSHYLSKYFTVQAYDRKSSSPTLAEVCKSDIIIFAVPVQSLEESAKKVSKLVNSKTIIIDVTSVKVKPLEILKRHFPNNPILGTHPIFGPQTEQKLGGIKNLPIVLTNVSLVDGVYNQIVDFLRDELQLKIIEKTADEHDKEMALVQGLSHFIGRALKHMNIDYLPTGTHSYNQLVELKDLLKDDSWELFETIQNNNPHICNIRQEFIQELQNLEDKLGNVC